MKEKRTKTTVEPSRASLREMPEIDFSKVQVLGRGRHANRARRSLESVLIDRKVLRALGGPDALMELLEVLARSVEAGRKKRRAA